MELFEDNLRTQWMKKKNIYVRYMNEEYIAYRGKTQVMAKGFTEDEACMALAKKLKIKHWNQ